jgi:hypothetical protein
MTALDNLASDPLWFRLQDAGQYVRAVCPRCQMCWLIPKDETRHAGGILLRLADHLEEHDDV